MFNQDMTWSYDLIVDYPLKFNQDACGESLESNRVANDGLEDYDAYVKRRKRVRTSLYRIELDHYLGEEVLPRSADFDIFCGGSWMASNMY